MEQNGRGIYLADKVTGWRYIYLKKKKIEEQTNWQVEGLIDLVNLC